MLKFFADLGATLNNMRMPLHHLILSTTLINLLPVHFMSIPVSALSFLDVTSSYEFWRLFQLRAQLGLRTVPPNLAEAIANCLDKLEDLVQRSASPTPGQ
jgi:hypothetical protein